MNTYHSPEALEALGALGDPTRRRIFERLLSGPLPVSQIAAGMPVTRPAVSQHLRVLMAAGLVSVEARGARRVYAVSPAGVGAIRASIDAYWDRALESFRDAAQRVADAAIPNEEYVMDTQTGLVVRKSLTVPLPQDAAFQLFTTGIGSWWPVATHSVAQSTTVQVAFEGRVGGRISEVTPDGAVLWGVLVTWDPPNGFSTTWHPGNDEALATRLSVRFIAEGPRSTRIELDHRGWEVHGPEAGTNAAGYDSGWDVVLGRYVQAAGG